MLERLFELKLKYDDKIIFIDNGNFYYVFSEDAYILSYLLGYKIINILNKECVSFPKNSLFKIRKILFKYNIGYVVDNEINYGDSSLYYEVVNKAYEYISKLIDKQIFDMIQ